MKARLRSLQSAALVLALALAACGAREDGRFTGYAEADLVYVAPGIAGTLQSVAVARGQRVAKDAVLFALDTDAEAAARAAAEARLAAAAAQAANLRKGRRPPEVRAVEQQLAQARANLEASTAQLARSEKLVEQGFLSPLQLDTLRSAQERDLARVRELEAQLVVARQAARPDEIAAAEAQRRAAAFDVEQSRWREEQKRRTAPVAALVFDVLFRVGEWVPAGAPVIALLPDGALKLRFFVPQPQLARIHVGSRVEVSCDGCPPGLDAVVTFVSPQAEFTPPVIYSNESRSKLVFLVEARPAEAARAALKPGQPIDVRLAPEAAK
jgi:HlyD family secretion protein